MQPGVLTGSPVTDLRITIVSGKAHLKHTEGGDFRQATYRAVRQGLRKAQSVLLEPWYAFRLEVPANFVGRAMTALERMHAVISAPEVEEAKAELAAKAEAEAKAKAEEEAAQQAQAEQDAEQAQDAASWEENWQAQNADADEDDLLLSDDDTTAAIESAIDTPAETPETTEA